MMKSRVWDEDCCHAKSRNAFWVAPPQRYVINRHEPTAVPHNLSVILVADPKMVEPTAFMHPIALAADTLLDACAAPSFFKVHVYVWNDTTMREILEEVLASSAVAKHLLISSGTATAPRPSNTVMTECKLTLAAEHGADKNVGEPPAKESANNANNNSGGGGGHVHKSKDNDSVACDPGNGNSLSDDEAGEKSHLKRGRAELDEDDEDEDEDEEGEKQQDNLQKSSKKWNHQRPPPIEKVRLYHVFTDVGKKVHVDTITVLRVDKPVFHGGDYTTMQELRTSMKGGRGWRNGDLLVLAPTVRRGRPATSQG